MSRREALDQLTICSPPRLGDACEEPPRADPAEALASA